MKQGQQGRPAGTLALLLLLAFAGCGVFDHDEPAQTPSEHFVLDCPLYCAVVLRRCRGPVTPFLSPAACMEACASYPTDGVFGASGGNSLQCRFTFALAARDHTRHIFCRNAGASGGVSCK